MTLSIVLIAAAALQLALLFAHGTHIALQHGVLWGTGRRDVTVRRIDLDRRFERAIANSLESYAVFVPLVVGLQALGLQSALITDVAAIYLLARLGFIAVYLGNIPYIRTAFWLLGQGCLAAMILLGLGWI